jgi:hypothetical protein
MQMKNPVDPGLLLKECLADLDLSVAEAAQASASHGSTSTT